MQRISLDHVIEVGSSGDNYMVLLSLERCCYTFPGVGCAYVLRSIDG
jgi:hypothetical protein